MALVLMGLHELRVLSLARNRGIWTQKLRQILELMRLEYIDMRETGASGIRRLARVALE